MGAADSDSDSDSDFDFDGDGDSSVDGVVLSTMFAVFSEVAVSIFKLPWMDSDWDEVLAPDSVLEGVHVLCEICERSSLIFTSVSTASARSAVLPSVQRLE